jgi:hypothetical protein
VNSLHPDEKKSIGRAERGRGIPYPIPLRVPIPPRRAKHSPPVRPLLSLSAMRTKRDSLSLSRPPAADSLSAMRRGIWRCSAFHSKPPRAPHLFPFTLPVPSVTRSAHFPTVPSPLIGEGVRRGGREGILCPSVCVRGREGDLSPPAT